MSAADQPSTDAMLKELARKRVKSTTKVPQNDGRKPGYYDSENYGPLETQAPYSITPAAKQKHERLWKKGLQPSRVGIGTRRGNQPH